MYVYVCVFDRHVRPHTHTQTLIKWVRTEEGLSCLEQVTNTKQSQHQHNKNKQNNNIIQYFLYSSDGQKSGSRKKEKWQKKKQIEDRNKSKWKQSPQEEG